MERPRVIEPSIAEIAPENLAGPLVALAPPRALDRLPPADLDWEASVDEGLAEVRVRGAPIAEGVRALFTFVALAFTVVWWLGVLSSGTSPLRFFATVLPASALYACWRRLRRQNRAHVTLDARSFVVKSGPIPGPKIERATSEILRFESVVYRGPFQDRGNPTWQILMHTTDGRAVVLPLPLSRIPHTDYVADALNELLAHVREPKTYRG